MPAIKPISPSLREKKRYLVAEIITQESFSDFRGVQKAIRKSFASLYGSIGVANAGILFLKDTTKNPPRVLMRVATKELNNLKSSLAFVKRVGDEKAILNCVGVSGTLKKARAKYMNG